MSRDGPRMTFRLFGYFAPRQTLFLFVLADVLDIILDAADLFLDIVDTFLETADALADAAHQLGNLLAAEKKQYDQGDDDDFARTEVLKEQKTFHFISDYLFSTS